MNIPPELFEASKQKLQKLQGQNERIYRKSKLLGESPAETTETTGRNEHTPLNYLKPQSKNYRNFRVKTNAYIENLICWESFQ